MGDDIPLTRNEERPMPVDEKDALVGRSRQRNRNNGVFGFIEGCFKSCFRLCWKEPELRSRVVNIGLHSGQSPESGQPQKVPHNAIRNQKYSIITFIPLVLFEQFRYFLNLYFLLMGISQFITILKVGPLYTYWAPLAFVISVTMLREAFDDFRRFKRDREINGQKYRKLTKEGTHTVTSAGIQLGDLVYLDKNERIPADMILLRTTERNGASFIRTDQLDGETDWKLRLAVASTQNLETDQDLLNIDARVYAEKPQIDIHNFIGTFTQELPWWYFQELPFLPHKIIAEGSTETQHSLNIENTLWANTVLASGTAIGLVIYTGTETRCAMNTSKPTSKAGLLDYEVNRHTKILFVLVVGFSIAMMTAQKWRGTWIIYLIRYIVLFSSIIPLSLRVNLDLGKIVYSWFIMRDKEMPDAVVRSTTIPEQLGRIHYLMSDKTGTLTQNVMEMKRVHLGTVAYSADSIDEVNNHLRTVFGSKKTAAAESTADGEKKPHKVRQSLSQKVTEAITAIALCHNVTPVESDESNTDENEVEIQQTRVTYQASSPDEVALVEWSEAVGLTLVARNLSSMQLRQPSGDIVTYNILHLFPFTSDSKRMGIIIQEDAPGSEIVFYLKGADTVMSRIVLYNDWLDEECDNLAREGLRTLVVAKRVLTQTQYQEFQTMYDQAKLSTHDRAAAVQAVQESIERDMQLLCVTGVEDRLQEGARQTLEVLRNAGIKVWMLTGDKLETATCIAKSSCLVPRVTGIFVFSNVTNRTDAHLEINKYRRKNDSALVITGKSLETCIQFYEHEFVELACQSPAVVVCRCSPTLKAEVVRLLKIHTEKQVSAIGDGGNDVSMIQASDAGIGLVGKEGRQASLAADFSLNHFRDVARLLLVHGRYSYKRSAMLSLFVIHRGLILSVLQVVFCAVFYLSAISLYPWFFTVGYSTFFTMIPVFSLVLDQDITPDIALRFPELYKTLQKGRELSFKIFFVWCLISLYQGGIIMYGALLIFYGSEYIFIVLSSFTALIITELLMVGLTVHTWHWAMIAAEVISVILYASCIALTQNYFDLAHLNLLNFIWKTLTVTAVSCIPLFILKYLRHRFAPATVSKLRN